MPELPEVETVRRALERSVRGLTIGGVTLRRGDLRAPFPQGFAATLAGRRIVAVDRRAKYLLFQLDEGKTLVAHLGMSGRFSFHAQGAVPAPALHDHVIFELHGGGESAGALFYNDARRFGLMTLAETASLAEHPLFAKLGPEPFSPDFSVAYLRRALEARAAPVKPTLMDAAVVVGVGNIYASEALFLARIDPAKPARAAAGKAEALHGAIRQVLAAAIESGGSSLRDFVSIGGETGYFQHAFQVYGREGEPCAACASPLFRSVQAGRSTFFCKACQK